MSSEKNHIVSADKVCVLGGSGFLGSHVSDSLTKAGYQVTIFDIAESQWLKNDQEMIVGTIEDPVALRQAISGSRIVFNFAGLADLNDAMDKPRATALLNVVGNINALEACMAESVERYVYASTVYVHSRDGGFYKCSKLAAESYIEEFARRYGLNYTIVRYGSLYGPRADERNGLYRQVKQMVEKGYVDYTGSPESMREYIHVEDAADASVHLLGSDYLDSRVTLTGQEAMRVSDVISMMAEIMGTSADVRYGEWAEGHYVRTPHAYKPDYGKKYVLPLHMDLGQGLHQLIESIYSDSEQA